MRKSAIFVRRINIAFARKSLSYKYLVPGAFYTAASYRIPDQIYIFHSDHLRLSYKVCSERQAFPDVFVGSRKHYRFVHTFHLPVFFIGIVNFLNYIIFFNASIAVLTVFKSSCSIVLPPLKRSTQKIICPPRTGLIILERLPAATFVW